MKLVECMNNLDGLQLDIDLSLQEPHSPDTNNGRNPFPVDNYPKRQMYFQIIQSNEQLLEELQVRGVLNDIDQSIEGIKSAYS